MRKQLKMALSRETLRHLNDQQLERAGAANELTGTATFTCADRTCNTCINCGC
jgi:hypothetical protein